MGPKSPQNPYFGGLNRHFKPNMHTHTTLFAIKGSNNKKNKQNKEKEAK